MLLGQEIRIYTDHKNLTYPSTDFARDRILRQRLVSEEYGAELVYVPGDNNIVADTLSRNDTAAETLEEKEEAFVSEECFFKSSCLRRQHKVPNRFLGHQGSPGCRRQPKETTQRRKRQGQIWKEDVRRGRTLDGINEKRRQPDLRAGEAGYRPAQVVSLRFNPAGN